MDQPQVDVVDAEPGQALLDGLAFPARVLRRKLGGDEDGLRCSPESASAGPMPGSFS